MTADRKRAILRLALSNLEKSIRTLPSKSLYRWQPPLTAHEVAHLRRSLTLPTANG